MLNKTKICLSLSLKLDKIFKKLIDINIKSNIIYYYNNFIIKFLNIFLFIKYIIINSFFWK